MFARIYRCPKKKLNSLFVFRAFIALIVSVILSLFSIFVSAETTYYVSASTGDDANNGISAESPWLSLTKVNESKFKPGDKILFKSGDKFFGSLVIDYSGQRGKPILFSSYGGESPPIIDAATKNNGDNMAAILIQDQDNIEISNLKIRNFRKLGRDRLSALDASTDASVSFYVKAPKAKTVRLHSNRFGWDKNHPKGRAKNMGDGTWMVNIKPAWKKSARYKWIIDGEIENINNDIRRGSCRYRLAMGSVVSGNNFANRAWEPGSGDIKEDVAGTCAFRSGKNPQFDHTDFKAFGILVKNTGKRVLDGFEFHNLTVEKVYPLRMRNSQNEQAFVDNMVSGIRFETLPAKSKKDAVNTRNMLVHNNLIRETGRFGIAARHKSSKIKSIMQSAIDYDQNFIVINNKCENLGGSCVLMSGVWQGLLEGNTFIKSGALVEPSLSVNRGSGAWFFRSKNIVAQNNTAAFSRGHNDSAGIHVDYNNENILVQYNFTFNNEGYGTEILGSNKNIIWRYNISVGDGTRLTNVVRPEGGRSNNPGRTIHVSDFAKPYRKVSQDVFIYNNTYVITSGSSPGFELKAKGLKLWNNLFLVQNNASLGKNFNKSINSSRGISVESNGFSGNVSDLLLSLDDNAVEFNAKYESELSNPNTFAFSLKDVMLASENNERILPTFNAAGKGIFSHVSEKPINDYFGNRLDEEKIFLGAGFSAR